MKNPDEDFIYTATDPSEEPVEDLRWKTESAKAQNGKFEQELMMAVQREKPRPPPRQRRPWENGSPCNGYM
jgi:hypothetical protein